MCNEIEEGMKKTCKREPALPSAKIKSLLTPISQIPSLSSSTLSVIGSLNLEKNTASIDHILSTIPAKEKYADLLDPLRGFPLPYHYKKLLGSLELIDKAINYLNLISEESTVCSISKYIQQKCKNVFSVEILQQIIHVYNAYSISWSRRNEKEYNLLVKFNENSELIMGQLPQEMTYKRKQEFHTRLLKITEQFHKEFLEKNQLESKGSINSWHPDFNLQEVPNIAFVELPSKANEVKSITNNEIFARNALVESVFTEMHIPKIDEATTEAPIEEPARKPQPDPRKERIISLCETLKSMFSSMKTPSIFYLNLQKKLAGGQFEDHLKVDLGVICNLFPQWLSMIATNSGTVIRLNRQATLTLKAITEEIHSASTSIL